MPKHELEIEYYSRDVRAYVRVNGHTIGTIKKTDKRISDMLGGRKWRARPSLGFIRDCDFDESEPEKAAKAVLDAWIESAQKVADALPIAKAIQRGT